MQFPTIDAPPPPPFSFFPSPEKETEENTSGPSLGNPCQKSASQVSQPSINSLCALYRTFFRTAIRCLTSSAQPSCDIRYQRFLYLAPPYFKAVGMLIVIHLIRDHIEI